MFSLFVAMMNKMKKMRVLRGNGIYKTGILQKNVLINTLNLHCILIINNLITGQKYNYFYKAK